VLNKPRQALSLAQTRGLHVEGLEVIAHDLIERGVRGTPRFVGASPDSPTQALIGWALGCAFVYAALFGTGSLLYGRMPQFYAWLVVFVVSGMGMWRVLRKSGANAARG